MYKMSNHKIPRQILFPHKNPVNPPNVELTDSIRNIIMNTRKEMKKTFTTRKYWSNAGTNHIPSKTLTLFCFNVYLYDKPPSPHPIPLENSRSTGSYYLCTTNFNPVSLHDLHPV